MSQPGSAMVVGIALLVIMNLKYKVTIFSPC